MNRKQNPFAVLRYLSYFTQVGLTVVLPPLLLGYGAYWLANRYAWPSWAVLLGILLGLAVGLNSLRHFLSDMLKRAEQSERRHK